MTTWKIRSTILPGNIYLIFTKNGRITVVPQAFVKSTEAVLKKGGIDEKDVW
jgi:hypothetical protein